MLARVTIYIPLELRRLTDDKDMIELEATTVGEALAALFDEYPVLRTRVLDANTKLYPYVVLAHNQELLDLEIAHKRPLNHGDRLELFAVASGG